MHTVGKARIHTYNGHEVDLENPSPDTIDAIDIAHALSLIPRFTGHTAVGWSVAQHSVVGSILAEVIYPDVKWLPHNFLLHNATKAYLGDVSSPLKSLLPGYRDIETKHRTAIEKAFYISLGDAWEKKVDLRMLATERDLFMPIGGTPWEIGEEPFQPEEFVMGMLIKGVAIPKGEAFWDHLWTPWEPEQAEDIFLRRMEKFGL